MFLYNNLYLKSPQIVTRIALKDVLLVFLCTLLLAGCSSINGAPMTSLFTSNRNVIDLAYEIAEDLEEQAFPPLVARHPDKPILTTTFVNGDNLKETSHFSRILQENIASRFVQIGYSVRETKLRNNLYIEENSGEIMLSRNLADIKPTQKAQAISLGTFALTGNVMYITAKLVAPDNANIISSVDYKIEMDENMLAMFGLQLQQDDAEEMIDEPQPSFMTRLLY